jgi:glucokinase
MLIAGDVGGTKTNLGAYEVQNGKLVQTAYTRFSSHVFPRPEDLVRKFVSMLNGPVTAACFGVAGPVVDNRVHATNLPWVFDGQSMAQLLKIPQVRLLNDLEASAYGISVLEPSELEVIHSGFTPPQATKAVIAAGTGLGEGILFWDGARYVAMATEGGHADFAPHTEKEAELWKFLKERNDIVSCEIILSGRGFRPLHEFVAPGVHHPEFDNPNEDPAPIITQNALDNSCPACVAAVDMWIEIYGSEAGNFALRTVSRGGMYVAGGIAVKILPKLRDGRFAARFIEKEKLTDFLKQISISVVLNEEAPLLGAAYIASTM